MSPSLPASHFLSLAPNHAAPPASLLSPSTTHTTTSTASLPSAVNTATTASADFDVDVRTGFLPFEPAVSRLPEEWAVWEEALIAARGGGVVGQGLRLGGAGSSSSDQRELVWQRGIQSMAVLPVAPLRRSLPLLRRAHQVLTFLLHFYVHTQPAGPPRTTPLEIPESISIPLLSVCPLLGLPPILTYADTVLYNSHPVNPLLPPSFERNPYTTTLESFTNTPDEAHFFLTSTRCELAGVQALSLMRASLDEAFMADPLALTRLTGYLSELAGKIDLIGDIILDVFNGCDPAVFYHVVRPWFKGGDADGPGSAGWAFLGRALENAQDAEFHDEEGDDEATAAQESDLKARKFSGPSAGQSTLIHALDVFLNVTHSPLDDAPEEVDPATGERKKRPTAETTFMTRMLEYMPAPHRAFLTHLGTHPHPVRELVIENKHTRPALVEAYDKAISALKRLREKHMRVATLYIIQQARKPVTDELIRMGAAAPPAPTPSSGTGSTGKQPLDLSEFIHEAEETDDEIRGTGGTALIKFLKMCRDNTNKTKIGGS